MKKIVAVVMIVAIVAAIGYAAIEHVVVVRTKTHYYQKNLFSGATITMEKTETNLLGEVLSNEVLEGKTEGSAEGWIICDSNGDAFWTRTKIAFR